MKKGERDQIFDHLDQLNTSGIDLGQFAKQMIAYIDQHLLEDTDFYLQVCEMFGDILTLLRWHPYPVVVYKIAINKFFNPQISEISSPQQSFNKESTMQEVQQLQPQTMKEERKQESLSNSVSETSAQEEKITLETGFSPITEEDFKKLWQVVMQKFSKPTAQANLKDAALIEKKEGNQIFIVVITKIAEMLLNNSENKKQVEELLSQQLGENIEIQVVFETKEAYFARKMGL